MKFKSASSNPRVTSSNPRVASQLYALRIQNYEVKSTSSRIIKSIKNQVSSLRVPHFLIPSVLNCSSFSKVRVISYELRVIFKVRVNLLFTSFDWKRELRKTIYELQVSFKMQITFYLSSFDIQCELPTDHLQIACYL